MKKKQFKTESKKILDLMINSVYTNREIFLRELISNASDAIDKLYYLSLTDRKVKLDKDDFCIRIVPDKENRTLTILDNGIGMTKEELDENLGVIAKSGSSLFKEKISKEDDINIIGQFGVGFYSAFMVAKEIRVLSKSFGSDEAYEWVSDGADGYTLEKADKNDVGTIITLYLKDNTDNEDYDEFLDTRRIEGIVKKYSDYVRYPIIMTEEVKEKEETKEEEKTLNSMIPIWKKDESEVSEEEYNNFYSDKFFDYEKPLKSVHSTVEGQVVYDSLLFIPSHAPYDYYTKEYEKGLQLYSNGVMIMEKCPDLLPDYFSFVKGLVDSEDVSLNLSREMLQQDRQVKIIAKSVEKKIHSTLEEMMENNREDYEKFFEAFGMQLKYGIYSSYGMNNDALKDLLLFYSSKEKKRISLKEYIDGMTEGQEKIYYASGDNLDRIDMLPNVEKFKEKGYEVLYLVDYVDEFTIQALQEYDGKNFINDMWAQAKFLCEEYKDLHKILITHGITELYAEKFPQFKSEGFVVPKWLIELFDEVLIGHIHEAYQETYKNTLIISPGSLINYTEPIDETGPLFLEFENGKLTNIRRTHVDTPHTIKLTCTEKDINSVLDSITENIYNLNFRCYMYLAFDYIK